jgi:antitoxin (DNA-binding transcriptional repressor) of toxin-antitoxin stability system
MTGRQTVTVGVTAFKAKCLALVDDVARGRLERVVLTKRGKPVAEIARPAGSRRRPVPDPWGALKGMIRIDPAVDLTRPAGEGLVWDADNGILHNE